MDVCLLSPAAAGRWSKYYVQLAGDTGGSHQDFLYLLTRVRQLQVFTPAESDYVLIFCPVFQEPAADIQRALINIPGEKRFVERVFLSVDTGGLPLGGVIIENGQTVLRKSGENKERETRSSSCTAGSDAVQGPQCSCA